MSDCAIGIVAHWDRRVMAADLADEVEAKVISVDKDGLGCNKNHRHVWTELAKRREPWLCVLEDDAVLMPGFLDQLEAALKSAPEPVVSLYLGRERPPQYQNAIRTAVEKAEADPDVCWITAPRLFQAVGVAMVAELVPEMVEHTGRKVYFPIDDGIASWCKRHAYRVAHTWPSLVDHRDGPSIAHASRRPGRIAWWAGARDAWTDIQIAM